ncbi:hypothetical protein [Demequina flava]|uniref:hypothetical protein n=1 Tax=Demequina flava TaxID=1095025 RepID=UPI000AF62D86|nr:hypothetical protein [Demequina flava]
MANEHEGKQGERYEKKVTQKAAESLEKAAPAKTDDTGVSTSPSDTEPDDE